MINLASIGGMSFGGDIGVYDVTNAAFLDFVDAGGYAHEQWWRPEDWAWIRQERIAHPLFWEYGRNEKAFAYPKVRDRSPNVAVRDGKWKLVMKYRSEWELYDMDADRTELHNLAAAEPERRKRMAAQWDAWAAPGSRSMTQPAGGR